jgi:hypothetical protein
LGKSRKPKTDTILPLARQNLGVCRKKTRAGGRSAAPTHAFLKLKRRNPPRISKTSEGISVSQERFPPNPSLACGEASTSSSVSQERFPANPSPRPFPLGLLISVSQEWFPANPSLTGGTGERPQSVSQERLPANPSRAAFFALMCASVSQERFPANPSTHLASPARAASVSQERFSSYSNDIPLSKANSNQPPLPSPSIRRSSFPFPSPNLQTCNLQTPYKSIRMLTNKRVDTSGTSMVFFSGSAALGRPDLSILSLARALCRAPNLS